MAKDTGIDAFAPEEGLNHEETIAYGGAPRGPILSANGAAAASASEEVPFDQAVQAATLCSVRVLPGAMTLATGLGAWQAHESGLTDDEIDLVGVLLEGDALVVVADFDQGVTATDDGRARPMHFRAHIPVLQATPGTAQWAGTRVPYEQLLKVFRKTMGDGMGQGLLDPTTPVTVGIHLGLSGRVREEENVPPGVVVWVDGQAPRFARAVQPLHRHAVADRAVPAPIPPLPEVSSEVLIEAAGVARADVGVLIDAGVGDREGVVAAAGDRGLLVQAFRADDTPEGESRALVLSPRLATGIALVQEALQSNVRAQYRARFEQDVAQVVAAALTAGLEVAADRGSAAPLTAMYADVGAPTVRKALHGTAHESIFDTATAFGREYLKHLGPSDAHALGVALAQTYQTDQLGETRLDLLRDAAGADETLVAVAGAYLMGRADPASFDRTAAVALGQVVLNGDVVALRDTVAAPTYADLASVAVRRVGRQSGDMAARALALLEDSPAVTEAWWGAFASHLEQYAVPAPMRASLLAPRNAPELPKPETVLRRPFSAKQREEWVGEAVRPFLTPLAADDDGRVRAVYQDAMLGTYLLSDLAVRPDPSQYPVETAELRAALRGETGAPVRARLASRDADSVPSRIVGLANPDRVPADDEAAVQETGTLFVMRWSPTPAEAAPAALVDRLPTTKRRPQTPDHVLIGEGEEAEEFLLARPKADMHAEGLFPAALGELRIFALEVGGDVLHLRVPMKAIHTEARTPVAVALSGDQLADHWAFITRRSRKEVVLDLAPGATRLLSADGMRAVVLPALAPSEIPAPLQGLTAAAVAGAVPVDGAVARARVTELGLGLDPERTRETPMLAGGRPRFFDRLKSLMAVGREPLQPLRGTRVSGATVAWEPTVAGAPGVTTPWVDAVVHSFDRERFLAQVDARFAAASQRLAFLKSAIDNNTVVRALAAEEVEAALSESPSAPAADEVQVGFAQVLQPLEVAAATVPASLKERQLLVTRRAAALKKRMITERERLQREVDWMTARRDEYVRGVLGAPSTGPRAAILASAPLLLPAAPDEDPVQHGLFTSEPAEGPSEEPESSGPRRTV